jgi:cytosine/adenosine deaminase-related metal-dependent hydrolase
MAGEPADVLVAGGAIRRIEPGIRVDDPELMVEEGDDAVLLPSFVDGHTHMDKTLWGLPWHRHSAGPRLIDKIENERVLRRSLKLSPEVQAGNQIRQAVRMGTTYIRSHVDVDTEVGLASLEGVMAARDAFKSHVTIQLVAFPQGGVLIRPGTAELLDAAVQAGADFVGGLDPSAMDRDPAGHLNAIFAIAERRGCGVDIHLHEPGELGAFSIELVAERTRALGMAGKVTISHGFCLGMVGEATLDRLLGLILENRISIMTHAPGHVAFPPIRRLREAGIEICSGSDGIRDSWGPYGNADMLERAMLLGYRSNFRRDEDLELALDITTRGGAAVMGVTDYGLEPGCRADFVTVAGETLAETVVSRRPRALVVKGGRVVARNGEFLE